MAGRGARQPWAGHLAAVFDAPGTVARGTCLPRLHHPQRCHPAQHEAPARVVAHHHLDCQIDVLADMARRAATA
ncbi:hypothetical protein J5X84_34410 [Streptosporangiaceae bacterium NEAU-GS5]|nr:hypothetical protein [Streptosporangiaceae bacterium NEAU-GS5]